MLDNLPSCEDMKIRSSCNSHKRFVPQNVMSALHKQIWVLRTIEIQPQH